MLANVSKCRLLVVFTLAGLLSTSWASAQPTNFVGVLNGSTSNADSRRSVTYYDGADLGGGPLFSVFIPFEIHGSSGNSYEDPSAITVDPATGDIYMLAFDSGTTGGVVDENVTDAGNPGPGVTNDDDTIADWDLLRINFNTVFSHWRDNFRGHNVRDPLDPAPNVGNNAPVVSAGATAVELQDYITYSVTTPYMDERMLDATHGPSSDGIFDDADVDGVGNPTPSHSNTFVLADTIEKIGELSRNRYLGASSFHKPTLEFMDENTLIMVDDARQPKNTGHSTANDQDIRAIRRDLDGTAEIDGTHINGGYNNTTTEAWESFRVGQVHLDTTDQGASGSFLSEIQSTAYHNAGSVRGMWVVDRDRDPITTWNPVPDTHSGDDVAFMVLDSVGNALGYRGFADFAGATKFDMQNNPAAPDGFAGRVGQVFVDSDTGDLVVVEEGATDAVMPSTGTGGPGLLEPATIRVPVNYDNAGQVDLGAWGTKQVLGVNGGIVKDTQDTFRENGYWSAYDSATDTVYFVSPGETSDPDGVGGLPADPLTNFAMDVYTMNVNTGLTQSFMNIDLSVALFFSGNTSTNTPSGDEIVAFSIEEEGLDGDFNGDGTVDAADYVYWRKFDGTPAGYELWRANFGATSPGGGSGAGAGSVPEPASAVLILVGLAALCGCRRRASR